ALQAVSSTAVRKCVLSVSRRAARGFGREGDVGRWENVRRNRAGVHDVGERTRPDARRSHPDLQVRLSSDGQALFPVLETERPGAVQLNDRRVLWPIREKEVAETVPVSDVGNLSRQQP